MASMNSHRQAMRYQLCGQILQQAGLTDAKAGEECAKGIIDGAVDALVMLIGKRAAYDVVVAAGDRLIETSEKPPADWTASINGPPKPE